MHYFYQLSYHRNHPHIKIFIAYALIEGCNKQMNGTRVPLNRPLINLMFHMLDD